MSKVSTICVTGATGFLGKRLSALLVRSGTRVIGLGLGEKPEELRGFKNFIFKPCDIEDPVRVVNFFKTYKPEIIFHTAAYIPKSVPDVPKLFETNVWGTFNILEAAVKSGVRLVVYSSSMSVYGPSIDDAPVGELSQCHPDSDYGFSKLEGERLVEHYARNHGLKVVVLRYSGIYGPGREDGVVTIFTGAALAGGALKVTENRIWDIVHVDDVVNVNDIVRRKAIKGDFNIFNIGSGVAIGVLEVARRLATLGGGKAKIIQGATSKKKFSPCLDIKKAKNILGFRPRCPAVGLEDYIKEIQKL